MHHHRPRRCPSEPRGIEPVARKEFTRLRSIFIEAGASAAEYASLEQLYASDRAKAVKEAEQAITGSLKSLLDDLGINNDALSLRDRRTAALAKYDPLKARVAAGDSSAYDDFAEAARALLDIQRQLSGSQGGYFALRDEVTGLSQAQVDRYGAIASASTSRDSPFASNPIPADNASVVTAIADQTQALLDGLGTQLSAVNSNLGALIARTGITTEPQLLTARGFY